MPARLKSVAARLDDLNRPQRGAGHLFHPQPDDRVGNGFFGQSQRVLLIAERRRVQREDRGEILALQPLGEDVKGIPNLHRPAVPNDTDHARHAVHEDASGAYLRRLFEEQTICPLQLLREHLAGREDDFEFVSVLERREIPPQTRRIADELIGRHLEQDDDAGLVELTGATIDELDAQRRLARPDRAFEKNEVAARNSVCQDGIQPANTCLDQIAVRHHRFPLPLLIPPRAPGHLRLAPNLNWPRTSGRRVIPGLRRQTVRASCSRRCQRPRQRQTSSACGGKLDDCLQRSAVRAACREHVHPRQACRVLCPRQEARRKQGVQRPSDLVELVA